MCSLHELIQVSWSMEEEIFLSTTTFKKNLNMMSL